MARKHNEARSINSAEGASTAPATHRRTVHASVTAAVVAAAVPASKSPEEPEPKAVETPAPSHAQTVSERDEIAKLAYSYWIARGSQGGSPEEDWRRAEKEFHSRRKSGAK